MAELRTIAAHPKLIKSSVVRFEDRSSWHDLRGFSGGQLAAGRRDASRSIRKAVRTTLTSDLC